MLNSIFYVIILIMSVVVHEVAHGLVALWYGDPTAKLSGRLTLNPIKHLDLFGSILLPLLLVISNAPFLVGWARPVPYNENNLRDKKWGTIAVASAGIISNLLLAIIFGIAIRIATAINFTNEAFFFITSAIVFVNIVLAIFNLMPVPPLDGSKILFSLLPPQYKHIEVFLEKYALIVLILFIFFIWKLISPAIFILFSLITGV